MWYIPSPSRSQDIAPGDIHGPEFLEARTWLDRMNILEAAGTWLSVAGPLAFVAIKGILLLPSLVVLTVFLETRLDSGACPGPHPQKALRSTHTKGQGH